MDAALVPCSPLLSTSQLYAPSFIFGSPATPTEVSNYCGEPPRICLFTCVCSALSRSCAAVCMWTQGLAGSYGVSRRSIRQTISAQQSWSRASGLDNTHARRGGKCLVSGQYVRYSPEPDRMIVYFGCSLDTHGLAGCWSSSSPMENRRSSRQAISAQQSWPRASGLIRTRARRGRKCENVWRRGNISGIHPSQIA